MIEFVNLDGQVWQVPFSKKYPESQEEQEEGSQRLHPTNLLEQVLQVFNSMKNVVRHVIQFVSLHWSQLGNLIPHSTHTLFKSEYPDTHAKHKKGVHVLQFGNLSKQIWQVPFSKKAWLVHVKH